MRTKAEAEAEAGNVLREAREGAPPKKHQGRNKAGTQESLREQRTAVGLRRRKFITRGDSSESIPVPATPLAF